MTAGNFYEVNEDSPELLSYGGKTFLMMGSDDDGFITPPAGMSGGSALQSSGGVNVTVHNYGGQVRTEQRQNAQGGIDMEVFFTAFESWAGERLAAGEGPMSRGMEGRYGLQTSMGM